MHLSLKPYKQESGGKKSTKHMKTKEQLQTVKESSRGAETRTSLSRSAGKNESFQTFIKRESREHLEKPFIRQVLKFVSE